MSEVKFTSLGSANQIGASCHVLDFPGCSVAVDFGAGQDSHPVVEPGRHIDEIFFTHGHRDHVGRGPVASSYWPNVRLWGTVPTMELAHQNWRDERRVAERNRKSAPFSSEQINDALRRFKQVVVGQMVHLSKDLTVTPYGAGHILGAVMYKFTYRGAHFIVTGDMSLKGHTFVEGARPPDVSHCELLVRESTYVGQLPTTTREEVKEALVDSIRAVLQAGGRVVIPSLSIDRMPEVYHTLHEAGIDSEWPLWVIGGNSPTDIYLDYAPKSGCLRSMKRFQDREHALETLTSREPLVILATSGMALKGTPSYQWMTHVLGEPKSAVFFVNYQDPNAPGGQVLNAEEGSVVSLADESFERLCHVERFDLSTHAKEDEMSELEEVLGPRVIIHVHGEDQNIQKFIDSKKGSGPNRIKALIGQATPV